MATRAPSLDCWPKSTLSSHPTATASCGLGAPQLLGPCSPPLDPGSSLPGQAAPCSTRLALLPPAPPHRLCTDPVAQPLLPQGLRTCCSAQDVLPPRLCLAALSLQPHLKRHPHVPGTCPLSPQAPGPCDPWIWVRGVGPRTAPPQRTPQPSVPHPPGAGWGACPSRLDPWAHGRTSLGWGCGDKGRLTTGSPQLISANTVAVGHPPPRIYIFIKSHGKIRYITASPGH